MYLNLLLKWCIPVHNKFPAVLFDTRQIFQRRVSHRLFCFGMALKIQKILTNVYPATVAHCECEDTMHAAHELLVAALIVIAVAVALV